MYTTYTRHDSGLRDPRSVGLKLPHRGRATIHYSASELTPIGRAERRRLTKPRKPGAKWYRIWRTPHTTPEEKARRRRISQIISQYNRAIKEYNFALSKLGPVDPSVIALEKRIWRSFQDYHMDVRGWSDIGYHVGIFASGNRYQGRYADDVYCVPGAHAVNANDTVGVTFITKGDITGHQEASFAELVRELGLRGSTFLGHYEVPGNATACPGPYIMEKIVRKYRGR